ncbi:AAEL003707-PA, partial [Aedes aegypti]
PAAGRLHVMAANGDPSMISPPSSISNGPEPQLPPLPPPLRSTQVLQPLSVFPVTTLSQEATYEYVFGGPLDSHALSSTLKLTSPPIRLRPDDDGRSSSAQHSQHHRSSRASSLKRSGYVGNDGTASIGSRKSNRSDGEDEDSLRQLLIE